MTSTWKDAERRVARKLGGKRVGCTGLETPDVVTEWLVVEVKHRQRFPLWLTGALAQAVKHAKPEELPLAVLHEHRKHDSLVVMRLSDFCDWFVSGGETAEVE